MGVRFGKYILHARVGSGGMADVWRATLPGASGVDKPCVVKRIRPELARDPSFVRMFVEEARISISLQHGNIVPVLDFGEAEGSYYLAMEYVVGKDLGAVLDEARRRREPVPVEPASLVAIELCRGLAYAHGKKSPDGRPLGLVHRDVSPSNILLSFEGDVKLSDFGIAKVEAKSRATTSTSLKGKVPYMSPEQAKAEPVDARTDIWAVGVVLYEMLTGHRPFQGADRTATLELVRAGRHDSPRVHRPDLPADLVEAIEVALAPDPGARFQEARAMQVVLSRFLGRHDSTITSEDLRAYLARLFPDEIAVFGPGAADVAAATDPFDRAVREAWTLGAERRTVSHRSAPDPDAADTVVATPRSEPPPPARRWLWIGLPIALVAAGVLGSFLGRGPDPAPTVPRFAAPTPAPLPALPPPVPATTAPADPIQSASPAAVGSSPEGTPDRAAHPTGTLVVNSTPWAEVWVDGRRRAESTPATIRLPAGRHTLRLANPELGLTHTEPVEIRAGETARVAPRLR